MLKRTKIVATIGPASQPVPVLTKMIQAGLNMARINFSHGTHESNLQSIENVRIASKKLGIPVAILADLQGPKIRVGNIDAPIPIKPGQKIVIGEDFNMDFDITTSVKPGERLLIEDGLIEFKILKVTPTKGKVRGKIYCEVVNGDAVRARKGINMPDTHTTFPIMTEKDMDDLKFSLKQDVDYVALSFVRGPEDVVNLKQLMNKYLPKGFTMPKVIVKVEIPSAVAKFDDILKETDAVMVARGDLGVEIPAAKVPVVQKIMVRKCLQAAKPVIVATQMMDSMIRNPRPTRAEVSDVANAVIDGADAVMLSGETSTGSYPVECVQTMTDIIKEVEQTDFVTSSKYFEHSSETIETEAVAMSACELAYDLGSEAIIGVTKTGLSARFFAKQRPEMPVYMVTDNASVARHMLLLSGITPLLFKKTPKNSVDLLDGAILEAKISGYVKKGDQVVGVVGRKMGSKINMVAAKTVE